MGTKRGRPKVSEFVEHCISHMVMEYAEKYDESYYKAWFRLVKHEAFKDLIKNIYKEKARATNTISQEHWIKRLTTNYEAQRKFYSKHIKKWVNKRSGIGSLQDWSFKYTKIKGFKK